MMNLSAYRFSNLSRIPLNCRTTTSPTGYYDTTMNIYSVHGLKHKEFSREHCFSITNPFLIFSHIPFPKI